MMKRNRSIEDQQLLRRAFVGRVAGFCGLAALSGVAPRRIRSATVDKYSGLRSDDFLGEVEVLAKVVADQVFTEGPAVDRAGNVFFTNVPAAQILRWDLPGKPLCPESVPKVMECCSKT